MEMTNAETRVHLTEWAEKYHDKFAWPTDICGYEQHMKFVRHRNANWTGGDFRQFVLDYANVLSDIEPVPKRRE